MNNSVFVGEGRKNLVVDLETVWKETVAGGGPRLIVLTAPIGWGKTRIIHQLYSNLAATQPIPRYWPPSIDHDPEEPLKARKRTHPSFVEVDPDSVITYMWWGLSCNRRADGRRAQILVDDSTQIFAHSLSIEALSNSRLRQALRSGDIDSTQGVYQKGSLILDVVSCFGIAFPVVAIGRAFLDVARTAVEIAHRYRFSSIRNEALLGVREVDAEDTARQKFVDDLSASISLLSQESLPILIVLDDAHDADESVMSFVARLLAIPENRIMMIATTWPDQLTNSATRISNWIRALQDDAYGTVDVVGLDELSVGDLEKLVYEVAPNTEPSVANALAKRFFPNPFSLRQALSFGAVKRSIVGGAIGLDREEIDQLESDLDSQYLRKWTELPQSVREVLMIASELGPTYVEECSADASVALLVDRAVEALSQSSEIFGWSVSLDSWVDAFVERDLHGLAQEQWRRQFRVSDSQVIRVAVRNYAKQRISAGDWTRLTTLARRTLLEFICKDGSMAEELDRFGTLELSEIYWAAGRYRDAKSLLERHLRDSDAAKNSEMAEVILKLSELSLVLDLPDDALQYSKMLDDTGEVVLRRSARLLAARAEADLGNYGAALELLRDPVISEWQNSELEKLSLEVRLAAEIGSFTEAYRMGTQLIKRLGRESRTLTPERLRALNLLSWAASRSGKNREALEISERAVKDAQEVLSDSHPELLEAMNNLARFLFRAGDLGRAVAVGKEVLQRRELVLGRQHQKTLTSMDNLAVYLLALNELTMALELSNRAMVGWKATFGLSHPKALTARVHNLEILARVDRTSIGPSEIAELLLDHVAVLGGQHPNTLDACETCARWVLSAGRSDLTHVIADFVATAKANGVADDAFGAATLMATEQSTSD